MAEPDAEVFALRLRLQRALSDHADLYQQVRGVVGSAEGVRHGTCLLSCLLFHLCSALMFIVDVH